MKQNLVIYFFLFICLTSCGQINKSDFKLQDKIKVDSLVNLATASDSLLQMEKSIKYYTEVLKIDSLKLIALVNRGRALVFQGQNEKGIKDYDKAIRHYPDERIYYARGSAYCIAKQFDKALSDFAAAIALNPKFGAAYYGYCMAGIGMKNYQFAKAYCDKADSISYNPDLSKNLRIAIDAGIKENQK